MNPPPPPPTSKQAIAALICAVLCVPLVGIALGIAALVRISRSQGALGGQVLAIVAIAVGAFSTLVITVLAGIAIPNFIQFQYKSKASEARSNLNAIQVTQMLYRSENTRFIPALAQGGGQGGAKATWPQDTCPETCPTLPQTCTFACLPWEPMGPTYYRYACTSDGAAFTCAASADLDGDGIFGVFYYAHQEDNEKAPLALPALPGAELCTKLVANEATPCDPSEF